MSKELVKLFEKKRQKMERAFRKTGLSEQGWKLTDLHSVPVRKYVAAARALVSKNTV